tara:strand:+ start:507 stop:1088 length:582 start_codon:yes stop_codon:yes gene_type:complete
MKVSDATTHVKYYASHQMMITKLQTFNDIKYTAGAEQSLRILQLNMERFNWFLGDIRIPKFNYTVNFDKNQITTYSEYMFGTQIYQKIAYENKDVIYDSMVNSDQTWFYQEGINTKRVDWPLHKRSSMLMSTKKSKNYGFKDYSLENFIIRGTKPLGKDEPHWNIAYVDLEAFCKCSNDDRKKAFKTYEGAIT